MKSMHKIYFIILSLFTWISPAPLLAASLPLLSHQLELSIDVQSHRLRGTDRLSLVSPMASGGEISFLLVKSLKISSISYSDFD